jgi:cell division protein FtsB
MQREQDAAESTPGWQDRIETALGRPLALTLMSVALIGTLALLYLTLVAGVAQANSQLQELNAEQTRLERQDAQLHQQLGTLTSPAYVDRRARELGLAPAPGTAPVVVVLGGRR